MLHQSRPIGHRLGNPLELYPTDEQNGAFKVPEMDAWSALPA